MIGMGFLPSRNVTRQEDLFITASSDGAALDAVAVPGRIYALLGTTTREVIARLLCVSPGAYLMLGRGRFDVADGDEFTGIFRPVALGAATVTWGAPGSRGLILAGDGGVEIQGLTTFAGGQRAIRAVARLLSLPTLAAANGVWAGFVRGANKTLLTAAGLGVNATPAYASAAFVSQAVATPTLTTNTAYAGAPSTAADLILWHDAQGSGTASANTISRGGLLDVAGQQQLTSAATGTGTGGGGVDDHIPAFSSRGITARVLSFELAGGVIS